MPKSVEDFCTSVQHHVTRHIVCKLHKCLEHLRHIDRLHGVQYILISGGVAANEYICNGISKLAHLHGLEIVRVPPRLCTDNAEMVAWDGIICLKKNSSDIFRYPNIPGSIYAHARYLIGADSRYLVPSKPERKLGCNSTWRSALESL